MSDNKNREFVRTLHSMIADFLRDNPDIDRSYYQEIWDWLEKKEDEDSERIRKRIINILGNNTDAHEEGWVVYADEIAWLEKQKEQRNYRKLYEDIAKSEWFKKAYEGKSLGGEDEQKEQKPADDKAFEEWINDWWKHNRVNNPDSYDKGDEIQFDEQGFKNFCRGIRNMYQQKPAEWSEEEKKTISFVIDVLRANHPDGFFKTSPAGDIHVTGITVEKLIKKLESLLSRFE